MSGGLFNIMLNVVLFFGIISLYGSVTFIFLDSVSCRKLKIVQVVFFHIKMHILGIDTTVFYSFEKMISTLYCIALHILNILHLLGNSFITPDCLSLSVYWSSDNPLN